MKLFKRKTTLEQQKESESTSRIPITCADEYPKHEKSRTGDIFVNESDLRTAIAVSYPQVGVRWVDSFDPAKILARNTSFAENPVLDEDFHYKNDKHSKLFWESADQNSYVNIKDHNLVFRLDDAGNHSFVFDLGKPVPEPWGLKFKLNILQLNPPSNGMFRCFFGLSSKDQNTPANVQQDFLGLELRLAIVEKYIDKKAHVTSDRGFYYNVPALERTQQYQLAAMDAANETLNKNASVFFSHVLASEALLVEIVRLNEKHYKIDLYSESGVLIESKSIECAVPPRNLRYICGKNQTDTRKGGSISGTISNVKFYNGVTGV